MGDMTAADDNGDENPFSELPRNHEQYLAFMGITEWPFRLTSELILPLRDELDDFHSVDAIRDELNRNISINLSQLDHLADDLRDHDEYLMKYATAIFDVPRLLCADKRLPERRRQIEEFERRGAKVRQTSEQVASRIAANMPTGPDSLQELNLRSLEFCKYPGFDDLQFNELPGTADAPRLMHMVAKLVTVPKRFKPSWVNIFVSEASVGIVLDLFWWCLLDYGQTPADGDSDSKEKLFSRVALNFGILLMSLPEDTAPKFLPFYPEAMAMTLYSIFYQAFPASRKIFGPDFKQQLINTCHVWMEGLQPLPNSFYNWPIEQLEMTRENSFEQHNMDQRKSALLKVSQNQTGETCFKYSKVLFDPKGCSPLIHKFLQINGLEPIRSEASKCVDRLQYSHNDDVMTCGNELDQYKLRKGERKARYNQISLDNEKQMQAISKDRRKLEKRFEQLQKEIDDCGSVLDMRKFLQDFVDM